MSSEETSAEAVIHSRATMPGYPRPVARIAQVMPCRPVHPGKLIEISGLSCVEFLQWAMPRLGMRC